MPYFNHLRVTPWVPRFEWIKDLATAAELINIPHEDYPDRVASTIMAIATRDGLELTTGELLEIHANIFFDKDFRGQLRTVNVQVGSHVPPNYMEVERCMVELYDCYNTPSMLLHLTGWYTDFETIHPFQDGNGRVGGVVLAVLSHQIDPNQGYLAPLQ